jgi:hypothetical protein
MATVTISACVRDPMVMRSRTTDERSVSKCRGNGQITSSTIAMAVRVDGALWISFPCFRKTETGKDSR